MFERLIVNPQVTRGEALPHLEATERYTANSSSQFRRLATRAGRAQSGLRYDALKATETSPGSHEAREIPQNGNQLFLNYRKPSPLRDTNAARATPFSLSTRTWCVAP